MTQESPLDTLGGHIESRLRSELPLTPVERFDNLLDLKNLSGESTGYIRVFSGDRIEKAASLSIAMAPGMRYFNIHIIPRPEFRAPRFLFEGMLTKWGSQVSMDLFPDVDSVLEIDYLLEQFGAVNEIYDAARADPAFGIEASRQHHMRAFSSPCFLCAFDVPVDTLPQLEDYATRYFDEWKSLLAAASEVDSQAAERTQARRSKVANTLIQQDPDRAKVVAVYGEALTQAIEEASML